MSGSHNKIVPGMSDIKRFLTLENASVYNRFFEKVVREKGTIADAVRLIDGKDQTSTKKTITTLNTKFEHAGAGPLLRLAGDGKHWFSTSLGEAVYERTLRIEARGAELSTIVDESIHNPTIRIGINSFSFFEFRKIDEYVKKNNPSLRYKKSYSYYRSSNIFSKIISDLSLDFAIAESVQEINKDLDRDILKIGESDLYFICNYELDEAYIESDLHNKFSDMHNVKWNAVLNNPIMIGDTESFLNLYIKKTDDYDENYIDLEKLNKKQKLELIEESYNIQGINESVQLMMDILIFDSNRCSLVATLEVMENISARCKSVEEGERNKIWTMKIIDSDAKLRRYAVKRKFNDENLTNDVLDAFWSACSKINEDKVQNFS